MPSGHNEKGIQGIVYDSGQDDLLLSKNFKPQGTVVTKVEDANGNKLEVIDDTNPILKFTDKNGKVLFLQKEADSGDQRRWTFDIEGNSYTVYYDVGSGAFGLINNFEVTGDIRVTGNVVADSDGNEISLTPNGIAGYQQGTYIEIESGGKVNFPVDAKFSGNITNSAEDVSLTVNDLADAVTKKHSQNTDTKLDLGGANEVSATNLKKKVVTLVLDGGGSEITTGEKSWVRLPFSGTIVAHELTADQTGSIVVDIWKDTYANYPPTVADTITASAKPTLSSAVKATDSTLTGWTTTVSAGDYLKFKVDSVSTVTKVILSLIIEIS